MRERASITLFKIAFRMLSAKVETDERCFLTTIVKHKPERMIPRPEINRPLPKDINPDGLIHFPMPEAFDTVYKDFDMLVAAQATISWSKSITPNRHK